MILQINCRIGGWRNWWHYNVLYYLCSFLLLVISFIFFLFLLNNTLILLLNSSYFLRQNVFVGILIYLIEKSLKGPVLESKKHHFIFCPSKDWMKQGKMTTVLQIRLVDILHDFYWMIFCHTLRFDKDEWPSVVILLKRYFECCVSDNSGILFCPE